MSGDPSLFGDDSDVAASPKVERPRSVTDWQVELMRKALHTRGLQTMADRRRVIEEAVGRPIESLRALTSEEALGVLSLLGASSKSAAAMGSTWDDRDADTWIDKL